MPSNFGIFARTFARDIETLIKTIINVILSSEKLEKVAGKIRLDSTVFSVLSQLVATSEPPRCLSSDSIRCLDFLFQGDPVLERAFEHVDRDEVVRFTTPANGRVLYAVASSSILRQARARSSHSHHLTIASLCSSNAPVSSILAHSYLVTISSQLRSFGVESSSAAGSCTCFTFTNGTLMGRTDIEDQDQVSCEFLSTFERVPPLNQEKEKSEDEGTSPTEIHTTPHYGLCKHILAAFIAEAVGRYCTRALTPEDLKQIFSKTI